VDAETGVPRWTTSTQGGQLTAISNTKVYLRSYNRDLFMIDRATGRMVVDPSGSYLRAGLKLREYELSIVNRFNDRMYFGTGSGMVVCLREIGQPQLRLLRDPQAPPFGYVPPEGIKLIPEATPAPGEQPKAEGAPAGDEATPQAEKKEETPKKAPGSPPD
jgi:hypothetical protein